jgi:outer membrane protein OmpA-like peptidoglycan-associated protein
MRHRPRARAVAARVAARVAAVLAVVLLAAPAEAQKPPPTSDVPGTRDAAALPRYRGAVLIESSTVEFDEVSLPRGPLVRTARKDANNNTVFADRAPLVVEGRRTRLSYLLPEGRSPLEVLRGYQQVARDGGGQVLYECAGDACGGDAKYGVQHGGGDTGVLQALYPPGEVTAATYSPAYCVANAWIGDQRYTALRLKSGAVAGVLTFTTSNGCDKTWNDRTIAIVRLVEPAAREQRMETVRADAIASGLASEGKVSLYALFFDTGRADLKPESAPQLAEMGRFLKANPAVRVLVVGHTDNQGALDANLDLSRRRAQAVVAALVREQGIAAARLTPQGVGMAAPVATNRDDGGRAKNRRVELVQM